MEGELLPASTVSRCCPPTAEDHVSGEFAYEPCLWASTGREGMMNRNLIQGVNQQHTDGKPGTMI